MEYFRWFIQQVQRVGQARRRIGRQGHALNPNAGHAYRTDLKVRSDGLDQGGLNDLARRLQFGEQP